MAHDGQEKQFNKDILPDEPARKSCKLVYYYFCYKLTLHLDSQEENYRAYKLFSMMDVDGGGSISLREINRVLMGETIRFVSVKFEHPDTGILFGVDEEQCVYIADFERESVASEHPTLVKRMRLHRVNNYKVKQKSAKELHRVFEELLRLGDDEVELEFYEPVIIINKFSCFFDIEIDSQVFSCKFPIGAYYETTTFQEILMVALMQTSPILQFIDISLNTANRQVTFSSSQFQFRLLFGTGPNFRLSCRYALGFSDEDTQYSKRHIGQPMLMNLHLGITEDKMEVLMLELFQQFDEDGSGEFEFEEFRDFYIKYLDNEESQQRLRDYAHYRFRDIERERTVQQEVEQRRNRAKRKVYLKEKYADVIAKQRQDFIENSYIDDKGMRRRKYRHPNSRPGSQAASRAGSRPATAGMDEGIGDNELLSALEGMEHTEYATNIKNDDGSIATSLEPSNSSVIDSVTESADIPKEMSESAKQNLQTLRNIQHAEGSRRDAFVISTANRNDEEIGFATTPKDTTQTFFESMKSTVAGKYSTDDSSDTSHVKHHHKHSTSATAGIEPITQNRDLIDSTVAPTHVAAPHKDRAKKARKKSTEENITLSGDEQRLLEKNRREEFLKQKRALQKEKHQNQLEKRQKMFRKLFEANKQLLQEQKSAKLIDTSGTSGEGRLTMEMMALYYQVKKSIIESLKVGANSTYDHLTNFGVNVNQVISSPAVTVLPGVLSNSNAAKGFEFNVLSSGKMHPAVIDYYLLKENHFDLKKMCNQEFINPVFFFSDFTRHPTRNSYHAVGMIKYVKNLRDSAVKFRGDNHLPHFRGNDHVPLEDMLPNQKRKYLEKLKGKKSVQFQLQEQEEAANREGTAARLTIQSVVLEDLPSIHVFEKNSPFVTIQCGYQGYLNDARAARNNGKSVLQRLPDYRYNFTTEAFSYAGNYCAWEDLEYIIKLRRTDEFIISVYSGKPHTASMFGKFTFKAAQIVKEKPNSEGVIELVGELIDVEFEKTLAEWQRMHTDSKLSNNAINTNLNDKHVTESDKVMEKNQNKVENVTLADSNKSLSDMLNSTIQKSIPVLKSSLKSGANFLKETTNSIVQATSSTVAAVAHEMLAKRQDDLLIKPRKMGTFRIRIFVEHGAEWDWFVQAYNNHQLRIHTIKDQIMLYSEMAAKLNKLKAKSVLSSTHYGGEQSVVAEETSMWSTILDQKASEAHKLEKSNSQYMLQIQSIAIFDMLPTNPWLGIFTGKHEWYLLLDTGDMELTTMDHIGMDSDENTGKEWSNLQWEIPLTTYYEKSLVFRIFSHRSYIGKYVLPMEYIFQRLESLTLNNKGTFKWKAQELEFFGDIFDDKKQLLGKVLVKSVALPALSNASTIIQQSAKLLPSVDSQWSLSKPSNNSGSTTMHADGSLDNIANIKNKINVSPAKSNRNTSNNKSALPWLLSSSGQSVPPAIIMEHHSSLLAEESITIEIKDILVMDISSSTIHPNVSSQIMSSFFKSNPLNVVIKYHTEAHTTNGMYPVNASSFPWNVQFSNVNYSFLLLSDLSHSLRFYVKYGENIIGECIIANTALVETRCDPMGKRELLAIFTVPGSSVMSNRQRPLVATSTNIQITNHGIVSGKLRLSYFLYETPRVKAPMSNIPPKLTLYQTLCYPLLVTMLNISVFHLRSVHTFHKNSPCVKIVMPVPLQPKEMILSATQRQVSLPTVKTMITPNINSAGSYAKWTNLYWEYVISAKEDIKLYAMQFTVISEALVVGTGYITFQQIVNSAPDALGVADVTIPLFSDPKTAASVMINNVNGSTAISLHGNVAGELKISFSLEPHVEDQEEIISYDEPSANPEYSGMETVSSPIIPGSLYNLQLDDIHLVLNRTLRWDILSKFQSPFNVYLQILCGDYQGNIILNTTPSRYVLQYGNINALFTIPITQLLVFRLFTENAMYEEILLGECFCMIEDVINNGREDLEGYVHVDLDVFVESLMIGAMVLKFHLLQSTTNDSEIPESNEHTSRPQSHRSRHSDKDAFSNVVDKNIDNSENDNSHSLWLQSSSISVKHDWNMIDQPFWIRIQKIIITELKDIKTFLRKQTQHQLEHSKVRKRIKHHPEDCGNEEEDTRDESNNNDSTNTFPFFLELSYDQPCRKYIIPASTYSFPDEQSHAIIFDSMDWIFIVSQPTEKWELCCQHSSDVIGTATLHVSDWQHAFSKGGYQEHEVMATMYISSPATDSNNESSIVKAGKMLISFQSKPLFPQVDSLAPTAMNAIRSKRSNVSSNVQLDQNVTKAVGNIYLQSIGVSGLYQVYPLFPNSPRIVLTIGEYSFTTPAAIDAGQNYVWEGLQWGRLSIFKNDQIMMQVLSNHETIGYCLITYQQLYDLFCPKLNEETGKLEENKGLSRFELSVVDGSMVKGKIYIVCYGRMHKNAVKEEYDEEEEEATVDGAMVGDDEYSIRSLQSLAQKRLDSRTIPALSLHTPTPKSTLIDFIGIRVLDVKPTAFAFTNGDISSASSGTINVVISCGDYSIKTHAKSVYVRKQLRTSFQWLFPQAVAYQWIIRGSPFVKCSVYYNESYLVGAMCINLREWLVQRKDELGIMHIFRSVVTEENLSVGKCVLSGIVDAEYREAAEENEVANINTPRSVLTVNSSPTHATEQNAKCYQRDLQFPIEWRVLRIDVMDMINIEWIKEVANSSALTVSGIMNKAKSILNGDSEKNEKVPKYQYPNIGPPIDTDKITVEIRTKTDSKLTGLSNDPQASIPASLPIDILKKFRNISRDQLTWKWTFSSLNDDFKENHDNVIEIEIFYGVESLIFLSLTLDELITLPRSYQGYGEYICYLNPKQKACGKFKISYFLHTATIPDVLSLTNQAKEVLKTVDTVAANSPVLKIKCHLITCQEISLFYPHCYLFMSIDKNSWTSGKSVNDHGILLFPMEHFQKDYVLINDRTVVYIRLHDANNKKIIGTTCLSLYDLMSAVYDTSLKMTVIGKDIMIGLNRTGRISVTLERYYDLEYIPPKEEIPIVEEEVEDEDHIDIADLPPLSNGSEMIVVAIDVWELARVGSPHVRNSPMVSLEYLGIKFASDSIPYADSAASWEQFFWKMNCRSSGILKFRVLSSSVIIGAINVSMKELYALIPDPYTREIIFERVISKGEKNTGKIRIRCVCPVGAVKPKVHALIKKNRGKMVTADSLFSAGNTNSTQRTDIQNRLLQHYDKLFDQLRVGDHAARVVGYARDDDSTIHSHEQALAEKNVEANNSSYTNGESFFTNSYFSTTENQKPETSNVTTEVLPDVVFAASSELDEVKATAATSRPKTSRGVTEVEAISSAISASDNTMQMDSSSSAVGMYGFNAQSMLSLGSSSSVNKSGSKYSKYLSSIKEASTTYTFKYSKESPGKKLKQEHFNSIGDSTLYSAEAANDKVESSTVAEESRSFYTEGGDSYDYYSENGSNSFKTSSSYHSDQNTPTSDSRRSSKSGDVNSPSTNTYYSFDSFSSSTDRFTKESEMTSSVPRVKDDGSKSSCEYETVTFNASEVSIGDHVPLDSFKSSQTESSQWNHSSQVQALEPSRSVAFQITSDHPAKDNAISSIPLGDINTAQNNIVDDMIHIETLLECKLELVQNTTDYAHTVLYLASKFVSNILTNVTNSLVAEQLGTDYNIETNYNCGHGTNCEYLLCYSSDYLKSNWKIPYLMAVSSMDYIIQTAAKNVTNRLLVAKKVLPNSREGNELQKGKQFQKRQGIIMYAADAGNAKEEIKEVEKPKPYMMEKLVKRGQISFSIPMKARITVQDIIGIDISLIDKRVMPTRPYITACKPYGNWAGETNPLIIDLSSEESEGKLYILNYFNLHIRYKWESFILKQGQVVVVDLHDARSGLLFGKCTLPYEECFNPHTLASVLNKEEEFLTTVFESIVPLVFTIADEYGGGQLAGIMRLSLDLSINLFTPSQKPSTYWDEHRMENWSVYPLPPISYGMIRQKFRDIAHEYDSQQLIHPSLYGFTIRYRGNQQDESRFKNPIFTNYSLVKRTLPYSKKGGAKKKSTAGGKNEPGTGIHKVNPFRFDPNAKERSQCRVCSDGLPGCPRCFMMPIRPSDNYAFAPAEFGFNINEDRMRQLRQEKKLMELHIQRTKQLANLEHHQKELKQYVSLTNNKSEEDSDDQSSVEIMSSLSELHGEDMVEYLKQQIEKQYQLERTKIMADEDEDDPNDDSLETKLRREKKAVNFHTNLCSYKSLRDYRTFALPYFNIYIKFLPTGYIKRFTVNKTYTIAHLYHMFNSHSCHGNAQASMILLPTNVGVFELHPFLSYASDTMRSDIRGYDKLDDYHINESFTSYVLIFIPNYPQVKSTTVKSYVNNPDNQVPMLLSEFFRKNTDYPIPVLPTYHGIDRLPKATKENPSNHLLSQDKVQQYLIRIFTYDYVKQQEESLDFFKQHGRKYFEQLHLSKHIEKNQEVEKLNYLAKQQHQLELRNNSQLRKFGGDSKKLDRAKRKLLQRESTKKKIIKIDELYDQYDEDTESYETNDEDNIQNFDEISLSEVMFLEDANEERDVLKEINIELASEYDFEEDDRVEDWIENNDENDLEYGSASLGPESPSKSIAAGSAMSALRQKRELDCRGNQGSASDTPRSDISFDDQKSQVSTVSGVTTATYESNALSVGSSTKNASQTQSKLSITSYFTAVNKGGHESVADFSSVYQNSIGLSDDKYSISSSSTLPIMEPSDSKVPLMSSDDAVSLYSRHKMHGDDETSGLYSHTHSLYTGSRSGQSSLQSEKREEFSIPQSVTSQSTGGLFTYRSQQSNSSMMSRSLGTLPSVSYSRSQSSDAKGRSVESSGMSVYSGSLGSLGSLPTHASTGSASRSKDDQSVGSTSSLKSGTISQVTLPEEINSVNMLEQGSVVSNDSKNSKSQSTNNRSSGSASVSSKSSSTTSTSKQFNDYESRSMARSGVSTASLGVQSNIDFNSRHSNQIAPLSSSYVDDHGSVYSGHSQGTSSVDGSSYTYYSDSMTGMQTTGSSSFVTPHSGSTHMYPPPSTYESSSSYFTTPYNSSMETSYQSSTPTGSTGSYSYPYSSTPSGSSGYYSNSNSSYFDSRDSSNSNYYPSPYTSQYSLPTSYVSSSRSSMDQSGQSYSGYGYLEDSSSGILSNPAVPVNLNPQGMGRAGWINGNYYHSIDTISENDREDDESTASSITSYHKKKRKETTLPADGQKVGSNASISSISGPSEQLDNQSISSRSRKS